MNYLKKGFAYLLAATPLLAIAQDQPLYDTTQKVQLISRQFSFTEGASVDKKGNVFFTDQPNDKIWKYDTDGKLSVFLDKTGRANGTYFDKKGNLIVCADDKGELWSIDKNGKVDVILKDYESKQFNGPNDLWINYRSGGLYFTDPYYQRDYWTRKKGDLDGQKLYYIAKGGQPVIADGELRQPNGIVGTPDGKTLYVADLGANKTYKYTINSDGSLTDKQFLIGQGSDGMVLDEQGNIYLTGRGVSVFDPTGKKIAQIAVPESWTGNVCFGGKDKRTLFITASKGLYTLKMNVKGVE
ncbi:SMP-30/gluconolactonase/LRE family protein [Mucilaginibacter myungsuensis]|uniref:SMP-30/gluconolactonase/LRE family protein n=1 Tax=Mucilaginibacter myungsuensis TaxID=649104 RepID=A0A929PVG9_9SPHI|nr:SMP-30/gluconolactonase/LRE family protein [Mucilaginibacter myungsuensis]MBE9660320.1 SMP-30/gluconolactonase/LRE family protein [Mucilaginibacter myungsuensis]MDN3600362.1 SMP-30/gluconolactonase/LRE family protein [Mucilaginibacter myungsuensis]